MNYSYSFYPGKKRLWILKIIELRSDYYGGILVRIFPFWTFVLCKNINLIILIDKFVAEATFPADTKENRAGYSLSVNCANWSILWTILNSMTIKMVEKGMNFQTVIFFDLIANVRKNARALRWRFLSLRYVRLPI